MAGYHKYVFDTERRRFIGRFEDMYAAEEREGFDSWRERDLRPLRKVLSLAILGQHNFTSVLDVGCGKGTFTHLLKKENNRVVGVDGSSTAIRRARESYPDIKFRCLRIQQLSRLRERFDLAVVMGTFAYVEGWPRVVAQLARMVRWCYIAEYVPTDPIGSVKSQEQLIAVVKEHFTIRTLVRLDEVHCLLLGESLRPPDSGPGREMQPAPRPRRRTQG